MTPDQRSRVMSRIRAMNTKPERVIFLALEQYGFSFERHAADLPGRPDVVFRIARIAVFIDGDFWHGWRFPLWKHKLSDKWCIKIAATRERDRRNFRKLRRLGWRVVRLWEHQVENDLQRCIERIIAAQSDCRAGGHRSDTGACARSSQSGADLLGP